MAKIKLDKGSSVTLHVVAVERFTGNFGPSVTFKGSAGEELPISAPSAEKQFARHGLTPETGVGQTWVFSKTVEKGFIDINPSGQPSLGADPHVAVAPPSVAAPVVAPVVPEEPPHPATVAAPAVAGKPDRASERAQVLASYKSALETSFDMHAGLYWRADEAGVPYTISAEGVQATAFTIHKLLSDRGLL